MNHKSAFSVLASSQVQDKAEQELTTSNFNLSESGTGDSEQDLLGKMQEGDSKLSQHQSSSSKKPKPRTKLSDLRNSGMLLFPLPKPKMQLTDKNFDVEKFYQESSSLFDNNWLNVPQLPANVRKLVEAKQRERDEFLDKIRLNAQ